MLFLVISGKIVAEDNVKAVTTHANRACLPERCPAGTEETLL